MKFAKENGCLVYGLFFIWMGAILGLPGIIFEASQVGICGMVGISICFGYISLSDSKDKYSIRYQYSFTLAHIAVLIGYIIAAIITIGWSKVDYNAMRELAQGSLIYLIILIVVFIIEAYVRDRQEKRFMEEIKVGDLFEEREAEEKLKVWTDELVFRRKVLWKVCQKDVSIRLLDFHNPRRTKEVYYKDLRKMEKAGNAWYRTPEYYDWVIEAIKDRTAEEVYRSTKE